jgi:hypothetical protein
MTRPTGPNAAAKRRRVKHERRIADLTNPLDQLSAVCSWLRSEAIKRPHLISNTITRVQAIAEDLNEGSNQ